MSHNLRRLAQGAAVVTGVGFGGMLLAAKMGNQESAPLRNHSWLNWINLGTQYTYFHFGHTLRRFVDAERAHEMGVRVAAKGRTTRQLLGLVPPQFEWSNLESEPFAKRSKDSEKEEAQRGRNASPTPPLKRLKFANPLGLAAGFDKNAEAIDGLLDMGFGFVEIGSVTPLPQPGNSKPRVFRLEEDRAIINRYGFNSHGADAVKRRLDLRAAKAHNGDGIVGVNLGKNKTSEDAVADYSVGIEKLADHADYLVVNVSSPNTPGLRNLQQKSELHQLLSAVKQRRDAKFTAARKPAPPLLLKIAPDLSDSDKQDIADVCLGVGVDGLIISNTTVARPPELRSPNQFEVGGLSGAPLKHVTTALIGDMYRRTGGRLVIIGVGGVENGVDAYAKIRAGASLVQVYSSFAFGGPYQMHIIKRDLHRLLERDGFARLEDAIGSEHRAAAAAASARL